MNNNDNNNDGKQQRLTTTMKLGRVGLDWVGSVWVGGEEESGGDQGENENIKRGNDEERAGGGHSCYPGSARSTHLHGFDEVRMHPYGHTLHRKVA